MSTHAHTDRRECSSYIVCRDTREEMPFFFCCCYSIDGNFAYRVKVSMKIEQPDKFLLERHAAFSLTFFCIVGLSRFSEIKIDLLRRSLLSLKKKVNLFLCRLITSRQKHETKDFQHHQHCVYIPVLCTAIRGRIR